MARKGKALLREGADKAVKDITGWLYSWSFFAKNLLWDGVVSAVATPLARYMADPASGLFHPLWFVVGGAMTLGVSSIIFRVPQHYWRYSSVVDIRNLVAAAVLSAVFFALLLWCTGYGLPSPTFPIIHAMLLIVALGGVRVCVRLHALRGAQKAVSVASPVLLIAAEERLALLIRVIEEGYPQKYRITGLVTPCRTPKGKRIHGHAIVGCRDDISSIIARLSRDGQRPTHIIVSETEITSMSLMALLSAVDDDIHVVRMPALDCMHPAEKVELHPIVLDDLLNRFPRYLTEEDQHDMRRLIAGKRVLVTGAGGSIGSELVRQIAGFAPSSLILLDQSEYALWTVSQDVTERFPEVCSHQVLADIQKRAALRKVFSRFRPQLIFHAAALKHVPLVEESPCEGILTNSLGTRYVADCAREYGAVALVMISTDKAVYPSSVMGASKRCAEMYVQMLDRQARAGQGGLRCVSVRFGNVLGSTGSVVPLFQRQLARGGPLTVTHSEMTRYFMTIPEAVGLVLQAVQRGIAPSFDASLQRSAIEQRLRSGSVFVLDMGKPVRIMDLARHMIRLAGLRPERDIAIQITGTREGEKLSETLFYDEEDPLRTDREGIWIVTPETLPEERLMMALNALEDACLAGHTRHALAILKDIVPGFTPEERLDKKRPHH